MKFTADISDLRPNYFYFFGTDTRFISSYEASGKSWEAVADALYKKDVIHFDDVDFETGAGYPTDDDEWIEYLRRQDGNAYYQLLIETDARGNAKNITGDKVILNYFCLADDDE